jgi:signal transduction histidine kinase
MRRHGRGRRRGGRLAFSITQKVAVAMVVPLATAVVVLGLEVLALEREGSAVRRQVALAVSADGPSRLLISLQDEQAWATVELIGLDAQADLLVEGYGETRRRTDAALAGFQGFLDRSPEETRAAFGPAMEGLPAGLATLRDRIDGAPGPPRLENLPVSEEVFDGYDELVRPFFSGIEQVASEIERPELRQGAELIELTGRQVAALGSLGREVGFAALFTGGIDPDEQRDDLVATSALRSEFVRLAAAIRLRSTGSYARTGSDELFVDYTDAIVAQVDAAIEGRFDGVAFLETFAEPPQGLEGSYQAYRERVAEILRDRAEHLVDDAVGRERTYVVIILGTGALALATAVVVARSLTRPLRSLAEQVRHMARHGLRRAVAAVLGTPAGVDVHVPAVDEITVASGDEIGEVAAVMNTIQRAVVELAVNQAMLRRNVGQTFVGLGRRHYDLLSRQLNLITDLQRNEVDPEVLGQLFQLDHLATRMRRNAESLLVVAGEPSPRRWRAPVGVGEVVRAAVGEVEDYRRVRITAVEPTAIWGHAAADLAHLLAELIENALLFSPPDERVEVRGLSQPAGYTVAVLDAGIGMPPGEMAQANRRLAGGEAFTVAPSRYLGHYVAGNLAARHGIHVRLQGSVGSGVTALVGLPVSLLALLPDAPNAPNAQNPPAGATGGFGHRAVV